MSRPVALFAAALVAVSPLDLWYAQEARMYAFVAAATLLAAVGVVTGRWPGLLMLVIGLTLGIYLDYVMLPLWVALSTVWMVFSWKHGHLIRTLPVWLVGSLVAGFAAGPLWARLHGTLSQQVAGSYVTRNLHRFIDLPGLTGSNYALLLAATAMLAAIGSALLWSLLARPRTQVVSAVLIAGIFLIATALMPVPRFYTLKKFALLVWPFIALLVAWSTAGITRWRAHVACLLLVVSLGASAVNVMAIAKDDWRGLVWYVNTHVPPGEPVWLDPAWDSMAYDHYKPARPPASSEPGASLPGSLHSHPAVWLVVRRRLGAAVPGSASEAWLDGHATLTRRVPFARLELRRYAPTP
jgi:hypothetical protein